MTSRELSPSDCSALEACSRMAFVLISNLRRGYVIDDETIERAFILATDTPSPPTAEDLAWAESVARDLPPISEATLIEMPAPTLPDWLEKARSRAKPTA